MHDPKKINFFWWVLFLVENSFFVNSHTRLLPLYRLNGEASYDPMLSVSKAHTFVASRPSLLLSNLAIIASLLRSSGSTVRWRHSYFSSKASRQEREVCLDPRYRISPPGFPELFIQLRPRGGSRSRVRRTKWPEVRQDFPQVACIAAGKNLFFLGESLLW